jgi:hypothetical protein
MADKFKYSESNFVTDDDFLDSKFHHMLRSAPNKSIYVIPLQFQYRIDLITESLYGDSRMAWVLNAMNGILYIEELAHGKELFFLPKSEIDRLYTKWRHEKK